MPPRTPATFRWRRALSGTVRVAPVGDRAGGVFVAEGNRSLSRWDKTGVRRWRFGFPRGRIHQLLAGAKEGVWVGTTDGSVRWVDGAGVGRTRHRVGEGPVTLCDLGGRVFAAAGGTVRRVYPVLGSSFAVPSFSREDVRFGIPLRCAGSRLLLAGMRGEAWVLAPGGAGANDTYGVVARLGPPASKGSPVRISWVAPLAVGDGWVWGGDDQRVRGFDENGIQRFEVWVRGYVRALEAVGEDGFWVLTGGPVARLLHMSSRGGDVLSERVVSLMEHAEVGPRGGMARCAGGWLVASATPEVHHVGRSTGRAFELPGVLTARALCDGERGVWLPMGRELGLLSRTTLVGNGR